MLKALVSGFRRMLFAGWDRSQIFLKFMELFKCLALAVSSAFLWLSSNLNPYRRLNDGSLWDTARGMVCKEWRTLNTAQYRSSGFGEFKGSGFGVSAAWYEYALNPIA